MQYTGLFVSNLKVNYALKLIRGGLTQAKITELINNFILVCNGRFYVSITSLLHICKISFKHLPLFYKTK